MNSILCEQLAMDFCCTIEEVQDEKNHFSIYKHHAGRRKFEEENECYLKIAVVNGKLLFSGREEIISWCREKYEKDGGEWFFEATNLITLDKRFNEDGYKIKMVHPFYIAEHITDAKKDDCEIRFYEENEIEQFRGDDRFDEAYAFHKGIPDVLGISAIRDGRILGMAGASRDSDIMWQIGINVDDAARGEGIGTVLVSLLKNEIIKRGKLPYYGTSMSHLASQNVALGAGFKPAWVELCTTKSSN